MSNICYIGSTPDPYVYHVGMTNDNRSPYERWKDADYRAKLSYVPKKVAFYSIGSLHDKPIHKYILRDEYITSEKENAGIRSDEIFRVNAIILDPVECIKKIVEEAIVFEKTGVRPVDNFYLARPHQEWINLVILDRWNGKTIIQPLDAAARLGKCLLNIDLFDKTGFRSMIVASYWLAANESFKKTIMEEKWDIASDIAVIPPTYEAYLEAIKKNQRVLIDVSLHVDTGKIDSRLIDALSKENSLIVVDEADFGAWTSTSRNILNQYIDAGQNLVVLATGTNIERALIGSRNIQVPITVSYLDLLEGKRGQGFIFDSNYHSNGPKETSLLKEIRKDSSKWTSRLSDIVEVATLSLDANNAFIKSMNSLDEESRPNMTKTFARRNCHIQRDIIRHLFDTSGSGTDVFTIYSQLETPPTVPAAMMFIPGTKKDVDNLVSLGKSLLPHYEWVALHSDDHTNRTAEKYTNNLIENTNKEAVIIVSCSMGARSYTVPNCIIVINCVDNPSVATSIQRASRAFSPGKNKKLGLVIDYCFDTNKTSVFESDLIRSALDNKVDKSEDTETTIRRVHGIVNFMRMDDYGYPTTLKETNFVDIVTSPSNLRNMASATIDIKSILSSGMLVAILNDVKLTRSSEKEFASLIDNAKTYIDKVQKSNKEIDLKKKEISDVVKKIKRIVDTVGNVHALSPSSDNFVDALLEIDMNSNKSPYYEDLVGIPAKIVKNYFVEHFPLSILDLYLIRARQTSQIEKFESEYAKDDFFFLPSDVLK